MVAAAAECDAAVLSAGIGSVATLLRAGMPLALMPTHVEQAITAHNVARLGAGVAPADGPREVAERIVKRIGELAA